MKQYKVHLTTSAENDVRLAREWYRKHSVQLPERFKKYVDHAIANVGNNPFAYAIRYKNVHIAQLEVFPYALHFIVETELVIVIAVHHTAMSSERWYDRKS